MKQLPSRTSLAAPYWEGTRLCFEIEIDGASVPCAIARSTLQELSGYRQHTAAALLRCFQQEHARIAAAAAAKYASQPESAYDIVSIWAGDLDTPDLPALAA